MKAQRYSSLTCIALAQASTSNPIIISTTAINERERVQKYEAVELRLQGGTGEACIYGPQYLLIIGPIEVTND